MQQSNFQKVIEFNLNFGVIENNKLIPNPNILNQDQNKIEYCLKLIREEMKELEDAVKDKNYIETVDALTDILYVVYGMGCRIGIDMDKSFDLVHNNNMSKLCNTEEEAKETVKWYIDNKEKLGYDSPTYRKALNDINWIVYNDSTKKILKSIKWKPVDLNEICQ